MTINKIQNLEAGGNVREKLNAVIDAANEVPNKVAKNPYAVVGNVAVWGAGGVLLDAGVQPGGGDQVNVPTWESVKTIPLPVDFVVQYNDKLFRNKVLDNFNNEPPLEGENTFWIETSKSQANSTPLWAAGIYISERAEVYYLDETTNTLVKYVLRAPAPFVSADFITELNAGQWQQIEGSPTSTVIDVNDLDPYDPAQAYTAGVYRSYVNLSSPDPKFQTPAIYQAVFDAAIGQTPETHPYDPETGTGLWWWFGDTFEATTRATAQGYCETTGELSLITGYKHNDSVNVKTGMGTVNVYVFDSASASNTNTVKPADIATGEPGRWVLRHSVGGGEVTDYENIFFEAAAPDKAYITRGFNWKIAIITEYGGVSTIKTSGGTTYTIGATVTAGDYLTITNTTINARLVAIIQPV